MNDGTFPEISMFILGIKLATRNFLHFEDVMTPPPADSAVRTFFPLEHPIPSYASKSVHSRLFSTAKMALHSADTSKLIFAPAGHQATGQAEQFTKGTLVRSQLNPTSPIPQFHAWFSRAQENDSGVDHPESCTLSTASLPSGRISSRTVYLKELDNRGFVIYTNLGTSRKAADIATNPRAAMLFFWESLQRQVHVEGRVEKISREESQTYYDTRARGSRIGAWASRQSQVLEPQGDGDDGRKQLEGWVKEVEKRFEGQEKIPVPEFWGGLRIIPDRIEFWQGRESRLHDRFVYEREGEEEEWTLKRLSP